MRHPVGNTVANADKTAFVSKRNIQLLYNTANEEAPNICTHMVYLNTIVFTPSYRRTFWCIIHNIYSFTQLCMHIVHMGIYY